MQMTNEEIVREYRQAKSKLKSIAALADLNCCKKWDIVEVLKQAGEVLPGQYKKEKAEVKPKPKAKPQATDTPKADTLEAPAKREATDTVKAEGVAFARAHDLQGRNLREAILNAAKACVCGDRDREYGNPEDSFLLIAELWTAFLSDRLGPHIILPHEVAAMIALLKIARIATGHGKADNWIDLAGYAACGAELQCWGDDGASDV